MEKFPNIQSEQFVVLILDKNTGHIYDTELKIFLDDIDSNQKVYSILNSLESAKEYAVQKVKGDKRPHLDFGYLIYNHNKEIVINCDN